MDKAIVKHLEKRGVFVTKVKKSFSERNNDFFKWFEEDVLGFDSEEYHREFWREAYKKGHTIGHIPQTLRNHYNKIAIKVFLTWRRFHLWYTRPIVKLNMCAK